MLRTQKDITDEHFRLIKAIHDNKKELDPYKIAELQMLVSFAQYIEEVHLQSGRLPTFEYAKEKLIEAGIAV